jgi:succinyl-CoA synthetase beta subunit
MKIHELQAKEILKSDGIPVPKSGGFHTRLAEPVILSPVGGAGK